MTTGIINAFFDQALLATLIAAGALFGCATSPTLTRPHPDHPRRSPMAPKYPHIEVQLSSSEGNAGAIIGAVCRALRRDGVPASELDEFRQEATSGDYDHLLRTAMKWVEVT